jgi:energy-coupling factor transporter ATP-binding protein EcfA2
MTEDRDAAAAPVPWDGAGRVVPATVGTAADRPRTAAGVAAPEVATGGPTRSPRATPPVWPGESSSEVAVHQDVPDPTAADHGLTPGSLGRSAGGPGRSVAEEGPAPGETRPTRDPAEADPAVTGGEASAADGSPETQGGAGGENDVPHDSGGIWQDREYESGQSQSQSVRASAASSLAEDADEPIARVDARKLEAALLGLRHPIVTVPLMLEAPGVAEARAERVKLLGQIDDYLLPRLRQSGAPILVALVGSTGAGKSTLLNSLVGKQVSATGIRRPTTNSPVLACHPDDMRWFAENVFLPTLPRVRQQGLAMPGRDGLLVLAASEGMPQGVALLDTPDIDSVVQAHRDFANQFLDASDLWLFVTTARRYADAAVWEMLKDARDRGAALAIAMSRVPPAAARQLSAHFDAMLEANGLRDVGRFVIPETVITDAQLPAEVAEPVRRWLADTAKREDRRVAVLTQTMSGVLDTFRSRVPALADQAIEQLALRRRLRDAVDTAYADSLSEFEQSTGNGSLLSGEVLARWQDFAGTGDMQRTLQTRRVRGASGKAKKQRMPGRAAALKEALGSSLEALVIAMADKAAEDTVASWRLQTAGEALLDRLARATNRGGSSLAANGAGARASEVSEAEFVAVALADLGVASVAGVTSKPVDPDALTRATASLPEMAARAIQSWQEHVRHIVRAENVTKRSIARVVSFDDESLALVLSIGVLGYPEPDRRAADAPGAVPQQLLTSLFGAGLLRDLGVRVRQDLRDQVAKLFDDEARRYFAIIDSAGAPEETVATELLQAGYELEGAR